MHVEVIRCGPFTNQSEETALERLKNELQKQSAKGHWILLSNVVFTQHDVNRTARFDETGLNT